MDTPQKCGFFFVCGGDVVMLNTIIQLMSFLSFCVAAEQVLIALDVLDARSTPGYPWLEVWLILKVPFFGLMVDRWLNLLEAFRTLTNGYGYKWDWRR